MSRGRTVRFLEGSSFKVSGSWGFLVFSSGEAG